jgi:hypothetical protein
VRDLVALLALLVGVILAALAILASQQGQTGLRWLASWATVGATGLALLVIGIGLWAAHRWAPYALAALCFGVAAVALVVALGLTARSVRLELGGPLVPVLIAMGSAFVAVEAAWLTRDGRSAGLKPMTGIGAVLIGVVGILANAILLSSAMAGVGLIGWPVLETVAVVGGAAALFGILVAYGAHRLAADGARWPAGLAGLILVVPLVATQLGPTLLADSPAWPEVIEQGGGTRRLVEIIPGDERDGAWLTVTAVDTDAMLGIEGFVTFVKASRDGRVLLDQRVPSGGLSHSLSAGDYELEAYYRSCDGWCGMLDPTAPVCSASATLARGTPYELVVSLRDSTCGLSGG